MSVLLTWRAGGRELMALAAAGVLAGALLATASPITAQVETRSDVQLEHDAAFRKSFDLPSSLSVVERAATDETYSRVPYSVPLSPDELQDMSDRLEVQMAIGPAAAYAADQAGSAGLFLDQMHHGRPVFSFTDPDRDRDAIIEKLLPEGTSYDVREVRFSLNHLLGTKAEILRDIEELWASGVHVVEVGPDIERNAVIVSVEELTRDATSTLSKYGEDVVVEAGDVAEMDACTISNCAPAKAGLKLYYGSATCTEGPVVRRSNGHIVMITAGHCFGLNGNSGHLWKHTSSDAAADSGGNTWWMHDHNPPNANDLAETDAGIFGDTNQDYVPADYNKVAIWDDDNNVLRQGHFTSWSYDVAQPQGSQVCRTGFKSFGDPGFPSCGRIGQTDHWQWSCEGPGTTPPCAAIDHEWKVEFDTTGGDSGGPYYSPPNSSWNVSLYGIVTHSVKDEQCTDNNDATLCRAWYSPAGRVKIGLQDELGVALDWFCVGQNCPSVTCFSWGCQP